MEDTLIPPGRYLARGVTAALAETSEQKPQVAVLVEILDEGDWAGHQMTWYGHFGEKSSRRTIESLRYLGWQGEDLDNLAGIDANEVEVVVEHEPDQNGKIRARASWINKPGGGLAIKASMDQGKAKAFAARMKGFVLQVTQGMKGGAPKTGAAAGTGASSTPPRRTASPPPAPQPTSAALGLQPDDIPF